MYNVTIKLYPISGVQRNGKNIVKEKRYLQVGKDGKNEEKQVICIGNGGGSGGYVDDRLRKQKFTD